jgi:hypothetical protein
MTIEYHKTDRFQDNKLLCDILDKLRHLLRPVQDSLPDVATTQYPVLSIIGNPRSGSTLLLQFLASTGAFSYPSNVLTRFAYAPYIGALIQQMLFNPDYDFNGDFADIQSDINFDSNLGKSKGALASNEFQHLFRNYIPSEDIRYLSELDLSRCNCQGILNAFASIESVFNKPFVTKAVLLEFNIPYFQKQLPNIMWTWIRRKPQFIMQSVLLARENYYGTREAWWSVKPKEYSSLKQMDIYHQIAGQVYFTDQAIERGLEAVSENNKIIVDYEAFCQNPNEIFGKVTDKYGILGTKLDSKKKGPSNFDSSNEIRLPLKDVDLLDSAYNDFKSRIIIL